MWPSIRKENWRWKPRNRYLGPTWVVWSFTKRMRLTRSQSDDLSPHSEHLKSAKSKMSKNQNREKNEFKVLQFSRSVSFRTESVRTSSGMHVWKFHHCGIKEEDLRRFFVLRFAVFLGIQFFTLGSLFVWTVITNLPIDVICIKPQT